jgi:hypothetical protein
MGLVVETQLGLAMARVGSVAVETPIGEDGQDLAAEIDTEELVKYLQAKLPPLDYKQLAIALLQQLKAD